MRTAAIALAVVAAAGLSATNASAAPTLFGSVWWDIDRSNAREPAEQPAPGVRVALFRAEDGRFTRIARARTNARGTWSFDLPGRGRYRIRVLLPQDASEFSVPDVADPAHDSDVHRDGWSPVIRVRPGGRLGRFDAGLYGLTIS